MDPRRQAFEYDKNSVRDDATLGRVKYYTKININLEYFEYIVKLRQFFACFK